MKSNRIYYYKEDRLQGGWAVYCRDNMGVIFIRRFRILSQAVTYTEQRNAGGER